MSQHTTVAGRHKAVHFGAGNIGRGFIAEHLFQSGYEIVFIATRESLVQQLTAQRSYSITRIGTQDRSIITVSNYRAINSISNELDAIQEVATADLVTCAVRPTNLVSIAPIIARGIAGRSDGGAPPLVVIACENAPRATDTLAALIRNEGTTLPPHFQSRLTQVRFANSAIDRIVPAQDGSAGLDLRLEMFSEWIVDRTPFKNEKLPEIRGIEWVDSLTPFLERKLYIMNMCHSAAAYLGHYHGIATIHEALQHPGILNIIQRAAEEAGTLVTLKHGIPEGEQREYAARIIERVSNPHLKDTVVRVGREPLRKMTRAERLLGPALGLAERGLDCTALLTIIETAFYFQNVEGDEQSRELGIIFKERRAEEIVHQVCQLNPGDMLYFRMVTIVRKVQAEPFK